MSEESDRIKGAYLMYLRQQKKMSLGLVAQSVHFNKGYLSRIEHGAVPVNSEIMRILTDYYKIPYSDESSVIDEARHDIFEYFRLYITDNTEEAYRILEKYVNQESCLNSLAFFYIHLIRFMTDGNKESDNLIREYGKYAFDAETMFIYFYHHLEGAMKTKNVNMMEEYLGMMNQYRIQANNHLCSGLWYECKATFHLCLKQAPQAYLSAGKANDEYRQILLFYRIRNVYLLKANALSSLGCFSEANEIYKNLMDSYRDDIKFYDILSDSYLWSKIKEEDYDCPLKMLENTREKRPMHLLVLCVCYYETEQFDRFFDLAEHKNTNIEYDKVMRILEMMAKGETKQLYKEADSFIGYCRENNDLEIEEFVLWKLLNYCEKNEDKDSEYRYQKRLLNIRSGKQGYTTHK